MAPSDPIIAAIGGDKAQREAAYEQITALAHGDNATFSATFSAATVHVSGWEEGEADVEAHLANAFGQFGSVLAVTLSPDTAYSLLTFGEVSEAQKAFDGAASLGGSGLAIRIVDTRAALGSTDDMGSLMRQHQQHVAAGVAVTIVGPFVETLHAADNSVVSAEEFQKSCAVLAEMMMLDPVRCYTEHNRNLWFATRWKSMTNAYNKVFLKELADLTRSDAVTVACDAMFSAGWGGAGLDRVAYRGEQGEEGWLCTAEWMGHFFDNKLTIGPTGNVYVSDVWVERICMLLLDVAKDHENSSSLIVAGAWIALGWATAGRSGVMAPLIEAGLIETAVETLHTSSPVDWVSFKTPTGIRAGGIAMGCGWAMSTLDIPNKTQLLLDKGFMQVCFTMLKAYELQGVAKANEANIWSIWSCTCLLSTLDLTAPESQPILRDLEGMASTIRFVLENDCSHIVECGYTSAAHTSVVCALAFGKQEAGEFVFTQQMIDVALANQLNIFSGETAGYNRVLPPFMLRSVVHLCISDVNKNFLLQSSDLIKLLLEALLLDPAHIRNGQLDQEESVKAAIQKNAAECFMQLALYAPGKDVLQNVPDLLDTLRMLADKALTEDAKHAAEGALMALGSQVLEKQDRTVRELDGDQLHVMMSYAWSNQKIVKRIVAELQGLGYFVWFDLERMKGSVMDAMSDAIEGAEAMLYCISQAYKESANCRLEANYAHQTETDMIPLLMEQGYKANGWRKSRLEVLYICLKQAIVIPLIATMPLVVGLILGTRLYYAFYEEAVATDQAFTLQVEALTREIGNRGKPAEAVPPAAPNHAHAHAPATRAPAATPAPASEATPAPARVALTVAPEPSVLPSMLPELVSTQQQEVSSIGLVELYEFLAEQRAKMKDEMESQRAAVAAEMEQQLARQREELTPRDAVSAEQLASLQERLDRLHASKLLADDELFFVEDLCADYIELQASVPNGGALTQDMIYTTIEHGHLAAVKLHKLVRLADGMASDATFARQLRRKFLQS